MRYLGIKRKHIVTIPWDATPREQRVSGGSAPAQTPKASPESKCPGVFLSHLVAVADLRPDPRTSPRSFTVTLGRAAGRFTRQLPGFELLGTVQRGQQIGALGQRTDGSFAQINGEHVLSLPRGQIERALRAAEERAQAAHRHQERQASREQRRTHRADAPRQRLTGIIDERAKAVPVTVRRRRVAPADAP